ncbi:lipopolysaccharide biosynthesis protein [Aphanothece microscopica]|uniref:lipopolysaccharide biosynthesis protein n=1 Tax=Aphanothece microscopica TaxID=1049561 RepID=UPI003CE52C77
MSFREFVIINKAIIFSGTFTIVQRLFGLVAGLVAIILLARSLGPTDFGLYSIIISGSMLASIAAQFGLPNFLLREIASSTGQSYASAVMAWGNRLWLKAVIYFAMPLWLLVTAGMWIFQVTDLRSLLIQTSIFFVIAITGARMEIVCEALKGLGIVALGSFPSMVIKPGGLLIAIVILLRMGDLTLCTAMLAYLASNLISLAVSGLTLAKFGLFLPGIFKRTPEDERKMILQRQHHYYRSMLQFALMSFSHRAIGQIGIQVLGMLGMPEQAGLFRFAMQLNIGAEIAVQTVNSFSSSRLAQSFSLKNIEQFSRVVGASAWVMTILVGGYIGVLWLLGGPVIDFLIGSEYSGALPVAFVLALGTFVASLFGSSYVCLIMAGQERMTGRILVGALMLSILMTFFFARYWDAFGAAVAHATIIAFIAAASALIATKTIGVRSDIFSHLALPFRSGLFRRLRSERGGD